MRNVFVIVGFFFIFALSTYAQEVQSQLQVLRGNFRFDYMVAGYELDKGNGDRKSQLNVTFPKPFKEKPEVIIAVNSVDGKGSSVRYDVTVSSVSTTGFTIMARTWSDTQLFWFGGNWFAIGTAK